MIQKQAAGTDRQSVTAALEVQDLALSRNAFDVIYPVDTYMDVSPILLRSLVPRLPICKLSLGRNRVWIWEMACRKAWCLFKLLDGFSI